MATPIMQGGIFQQGALPWWLTFKTESDESGAIRYDLYDKTTGQRVIQDQSGAFSYADGTPVPTSLQNSQPSQVSLVSAQGLPQGLVAVKDASGKTRYASALRGDASDYAKITGGVLEGGLLAGRPGGGGTSIAQDASGQQYVVMPEDMTVSRPRPDNAGIMSNFVFRCRERPIRCFGYGQRGYGCDYGRVECAGDGRRPAQGRGDGRHKFSG